MVRDRSSTASEPRKTTIATRVLVSFAVTVIAFAVTIGWSVYAQRRTVEDHEELANGYVPAALKLGQLRAAQATLSTLVDGVPDERSPLSTRLVLESLVAVRTAKFTETRRALSDYLPIVGRDQTKRLSLELITSLDAMATIVQDDHLAIDQLFAALSDGDKDRASQLLIVIGAREHDADERLRAISDKLHFAMKTMSETAHEREVSATLALIILATLTLFVGVGVSIHTRRLLEPLERVIERAKAVARGDLTPRPVFGSDDEIGELSSAFEQMVDAVGRAQVRALSNERLAAIGNMAAHVTHEIRNPLSALGLNIELLEEELSSSSLSGDARSLVSAVRREVERLEHLSEEYLRVARLPSPKIEAEDIAEALREIVSFARPEFERAGCSITLSFDKALPLAQFDEGQLRQAVLNLMRNAREAMPDGGQVDVRAYAQGMSIFIEVLDRGVGIPEYIRDRVFDPFVSTKGEGTGLGLAITRHIVEEHGGKVSCSPRDGGGTRFCLSIPIAPPRVNSASMQPSLLAPLGSPDLIETQRAAR